MNSPLLQPVIDQLAHILRPQVDATEPSECPFEREAKDTWAKRMTYPAYAGDLMSEAIGYKTNVELTALVELIQISDVSGVFEWLQDALDARLDHEIKAMAKVLEQGYENEQAMRDGHYK